MAKGTWLKRFIVGLVAAVSAFLFAKKKVAAPGSKDGEFKLAPVPDARASGPEDATPLTEDEQKMMAERAPDFKGFAAPPRENVAIQKTPGNEDATPLTEEEQTAFAQQQGVSGSTGAPPPISYEISKLNAEEAEKLRKAGDAEAADALEQRVYFTAPEPVAGDTPPPISHEIAQKNADEAAALRESGDADAADALEKRMYFAAPADAADGDRDSGGDTTPEPTSEAFDAVTDGADHAGQEATEGEDPTEVGLDIDVELDEDDDSVPELTSEAFDGGGEALGISAGNQESAARGFITVPDEQTWCPDEFPIKGNASSRIYHQPGESSYDVTNPEICFATEEAAASQGFRPRKR